MSEGMEQLISVIRKCPTAPHFVEFARQELLKKGFVEISEVKPASEIPNQFFVVRDGRSITVCDVADLSRGTIFSVPLDSMKMATKPNTQLSEGNYEMFRVAPTVYCLAMSYMDRDLKIAGRVIIERDGKIETKLFETDRPVCVIPTAEKSRPFNAEKDLMPIIALADSFDAPVENQSGALLSVIAESAGCKVSEILDFNVDLIDSNPPKIIGGDKSLLAGQHVANLSTGIAAFLEFLNADKCTTGFRVFSGYDSWASQGNSRVGSASTLLRETLSKLGVPPEALSESTIFTPDDLAASSPNWSTLFGEPVENRDFGSGAYIIRQHNRGGTTDRISEVQLTAGAKQEGIKLVTFTQGSRYAIDPTCGSSASITLGVPIVQLGIPTLGKYSIRETVAVSDLAEFRKTAAYIWRAWNSRDMIENLV